MFEKTLILIILAVKSISVQDSTYYNIIKDRQLNESFIIDNLNESYLLKSDFECLNLCLSKPWCKSIQFCLNITNRQNCFLYNKIPSQQYDLIESPLSQNLIYIKYSK